MINEAAFPVVHPDGSGVQYFGMSLRDYLAAKSLQGMLANDEAIQRFRNMAMCEHFECDTLVATAAYSMADAMLAERAK